MNELFGIVLPLLSSGAELGDIIREIGGSGYGVSRFDGLTALLQHQASLRFSRSLAPEREAQHNRLGSAIDFALDRIGFKPYTSGGQSAAEIVKTLYYFMPDTMGAALGIPNRQKFDSILSNGAAGISEAAGYGNVDILNPYSVLSAYRNTMRMGNVAYDLAVDKNGGFNIGFGHGLNMGEAGKVTQRLLTSRLPYREYAEENGTWRPVETGMSVDPNGNPEKFKKNLEKLGSEFNDAASMLAKITGSVEEALNVMDRLGGGNFLGGTAEQAIAVANRARKMAASIRVTSAIAGINPQEMYANMNGLQHSMAQGMGITPYFAQASGFGGILGDIAFNGTMGYLNWAAQNPGATEPQKQMALFAANARTSSYMSANGSAFAAAVADNMTMFNENERRLIIESMRSGRATDVEGLVRGKIGTRKYEMYMSDPAVKIAAMDRASNENPEFFRDLNNAMVAGNLKQAEDYGSSRITRKILGDMGDFVKSVTGEKGFANDLDNAAKEALKGIAVRNGIPADRVDGMKTDSLRDLLKARGVDREEIDRTEREARISAARGVIEGLRMNGEDVERARSRLREKIAGSDYWKGSESQRRMLGELDLDSSEANLMKVYREYSDGLSGKNGKEFENKRKDVFGGRITGEEYERWNKDFDRMERSNLSDFTAQERLDEIENERKRSRLEKLGTLTNSIVRLSKDLNVSDRTAMDAFAADVADLADNGIVDIGGDDRALSRTFRAATRDIVSGVFGSGLGNLKDDALRKFTDEFSEKVSSGLSGGSSFRDSYIAAAKFAIESNREALGDDGVKELERQIKEAKNHESEFSKKTLSKESLLSAAKTQIDRQTGERDDKAMKALRELVSGNSAGGGELTDLNRKEKFSLAARDARVFAGGQGDLDRMTVAGISKILSDNIRNLDDGTRNKLAERANSLVNDGRGEIGFGEAIRDVIGEYAKTDGLMDAERRELEEGSRRIGLISDVGGSVLENVLGQMHGSGQRVRKFEALASAGSSDQAMMILAAANARAMGLDMRQLDLGEKWEPILSWMDDTKSDSKLNAFSNAMKVGGASFRTEAIKDTERRIAELRQRLKDDFDEKTIRAALTGTGDAAEVAMKKLKERLGEGERSENDVNGDIALLHSLRKNNIGGKSGISVMLSEADFLNSRNGDAAKQSDEDLVRITKDANTYNSEIFGLVKAISEFASKAEPFFADPKQVFNVHVESWE